jgi:signal transduction histidine kinase
MVVVGRLRTAFKRTPLRRRLPVAFAAIALLTIVILGAILVPLLSAHYSQAEMSYLKAGAQQAEAELSGVDWAAVAAGNASAAATSALREVQAVALSTQLRVRVFDTKGSLLVDSGPVAEIDPTTVTADLGNQVPDGTTTTSGPSGPDGRSDHRTEGKSGRLPSPVGSGLFGGDGSTAGPRSGRTIDAALSSSGVPVAVVRLSEGPAYGAAVLQTTFTAWLVAAAAAVVLGGLAGWMTSRRLTRPLLAITAASDKMARGNLSVRADVDRADEVGALAASFNSMADMTQQTVLALRRFVADAAHELGTPLTALQADLELAQDQTDDATRRRLTDRALRQSRRLQRLSSDLLRLSRLDMLAAQLPLEPLDLVPLLRRLADGFASRAEQAGIDFTLDLPHRELVVRSQVDGLSTAVGNLVDNALKFTPAGGSVILTAKAESGEVVISVADTGIGVPSEDLDALFARFHRGRNAAGYPGSGLGLAIVRAIMDGHDGTAACESSSAGSRFELRLPLA